MILAAVKASCSGRWSGWSSGVVCQSSPSSRGYFMILWTGLMSSEPMFNKLGFPLHILTHSRYQIHWCILAYAVCHPKIKCNKWFKIEDTVKNLLLIINFPVKQEEKQISKKVSWTVDCENAKSQIYLWPVTYFSANTQVVKCFFISSSFSQDLSDALASSWW